MSLIDSAGRSGRLRTRAQKRAMTMESAPRSSKKCASVATRSTCRTSASTSARGSCVGGVVDAVLAGWSVGSVVRTVPHSATTRAPRAGVDGCGPGGSSVHELADDLGRGGGPRSRDALLGVGAEQVLAVEVLDPVGLVEGVEIALAEIRGDGHRGDVRVAVPGQPGHRTADHRAGGAPEQEPVTGHPVTG